MATIKEFYDHPDQSEIDSLVVSINTRPDGKIAVILDRTIMYPEGGGQPSDHGSIAGLPVIAAEEADDVVVHLLDARDADLKAAGIVAGQSVRSKVDLVRRREHSEQHSAQHLLSAVILRLLDAATLSFHLGEAYSSIDIDIPPFDRPSADAVEDEVMRIIRDDYSVMTHVCRPEDTARFPLRKQPSVEAGELRIVEFDGLEYSACCGTHVKSTRDIGLFRILKVEKYKGGCRLYFVAGGRAYADYRRLATLMRDTASQAGSSDEELPGIVAGYRERIKNLEYGLNEAKDSAAMARAELLSGNDAGKLIFAEAETFDSASRLARALSRLGRVSVVACREERKIVASSPNDQDSLAVDALFGPQAKAQGGKGGGGKTFFQAAFPDEPSLDAFLVDASLATA
ncbi:MAG: alanyl-tRNA editing protein [Spirochaetia bacterium]|jgi:alanyl-tRNA synthetase|nr:alanyl-tRNA editing protein [Spirochaetia bacterium]